MKEVIYKKPEIPPDRYHNQPCQVCGGKLVKDAIPCPDGIIGCLVRHYGFICESCFRIFQ